MDMKKKATSANADIQTGRPMEPAMALALAANFGSVEHWRENFVALAKNVGGGQGRVTLAFRPRDSALVNVATCASPNAAGDDLPLLVLETRELSANVDGFIAGIDWADVYERYQHAVHAVSEAFAATHADVADTLLLDVRRAGVFALAATMIPGARWRDPAAVAEWSAELPSDREVIVYCVYGHEVGRATAMRLRAAGKNARFLGGGIDAWQAAGRPLDTKGEAQ